MAAIFKRSQADHGASEEEGDEEDVAYENMFNSMKNENTDIGKPHAQRPQLDAIKMFNSRIEIPADGDGHSKPPQSPPQLLMPFPNTGISGAGFIPPSVFENSLPPGANPTSPAELYHQLTFWQWVRFK